MMDLESNRITHQNIKHLLEQPPTKTKNIIRYGFHFSEFFKEREFRFRAVKGDEDIFIEVTMSLKPYEIEEDDFQSQLP